MYNIFTYVRIKFRITKEVYLNKYVINILCEVYQALLRVLYLFRTLSSENQALCKNGLSAEHVLLHF